MSMALPKQLLCWHSEYDCMLHVLNTATVRAGPAAAAAAFNDKDDPVEHAFANWRIGLAVQRAHAKGASAAHQAGQ